MGESASRLKKAGVSEFVSWKICELENLQAKTHLF